MSSSVQVSSSATSNFQPIFEKAMEEYKKKTSKDLTTHPLAIQMKGCHSPEAILTVLEGKANELNRSRSSDERLTKWLNPTVNILNALSATLGQGASLVFPPTTIIFAGIGILLVAAKSTVANRDVLVKLFGRIENFFERLKVYTNVPPSPTVTDELGNIMAEVLLILAIATKGIKEGRTKIFFKKVAGMNDLEDALQRFGELEQRELLTGIAQVASDTAVLKDDAKETKAYTMENKADAQDIKADTKEIKADAKETKADAQETKADAKEIKVMVKDIVNKMDARSWEEFFQKLKPWLSPPDPSTNYTTGLRNHYEETANWFFEGRIFQEWHSTGGSLLWIHGKPGSGKTILCSTIIQRVALLSKGGKASMAYFYFDFQDEDKKHRHNLLPSLLVQLAARSVECCNIISRLYLAHEEGREQPSDEDLKNCLTDMLSVSPEHPMYIIIDALDECPNSSGVRSPRGHVLSFVQELVELRLRNLHICITSRPEIDIYNRLEPLTSLRISLHDQTGHREDIAKFIWSEVDVIANDKRWRDDDKKLVKETLSEKADGMFRWVFCQLEMLRLCLRSRVRHFLHELPDSLDETYERILKGIHKTNRGYVQQLLQCLAATIRPLRVEELAEILTFNAEATQGEVPTVDADLRREEQEHELLSACPSLIVVVGSDDSRVVQFSHFSVKEFLTSDRLSTSREDIVRYHIIPEAAHTTIARASLGVLLRLDDSILSSKAISIPLVLYAAEHWVSHAQFGSVSSRVMGQMKALFDSDGPYFAAWLRICDIDRTLPEGTTPKPLYYSALCGFYDLVEHLLKKYSEDINAIGGRHDYPLIAALYGGYTQVAELLFQHGANVEVQGKDEQTPLHRALGWPNRSAVVALQFLLKHGANVNARRKDLWTPLHLAAARGDFGLIQFPDSGAEGASPIQGLLSLGVEVERALLYLGANVNAKDNWGWTPLHRALGAGGYSDEQRFGIAQLLVERGADVNAQDQCHGTPLHLVSYFFQLKLVRMLVDNGANVNSKNNRGQTPLHRVLGTEDCSSEDRFNVARLLLEHGADVNARDVCGETPLHLAPYFLELKLVRMLVDLAADVNAVDNQGRTPLHRVLETYDHPDKDRFSIVQLLIERGVDVNTRNYNHETLLHLASYQLELKLVRILLDRGANINAEDNHGRTPLHRVLEAQGHADGDHFEIAKLLVERGAVVNARDEGDNTPLHLASYQSELMFVRILVDNGANVNAEDNRGRTPLYLVSEAKEFSREDRFSIAQLLLERGADPNTRHENRETVLHLASYQLELKFVRILVDHGANVNAEDNEGRTPLLRVLGARGFSDEDGFAIAQLLMEHGADANARHNNRETLLHMASYQLELKFVRMLVDNGANVNAEDEQGRTPLYRVFEAKESSREDRFSIAQLLLERGADANARYKDRETLLHLASYQLELRLVRMLVDRGANLNAEDNQGRTPLQRVLEVHGNHDEDRYGFAQLLIESGADVNARDNYLGTPLHLASYQGELKFVRMLIDHGANVNAKDNEGRTPLYRVSEAKGSSGEDSFGITQLLVENGADLNTRHKNRETRLHLASYQGEPQLVRMLVDRGANVNAKDNWDQTPLHRVLATEDLPNKERFSVAQLLIEHGADVNVRNVCGETPLHLAPHFWDLNLVRILVDCGANVNAEDRQGLTPLHRVLEAKGFSDKDRIDIAQLLAERGADVNARHENHDTPLHLASCSLELSLVQILLDHGADANAEDNRGRTPLHRVSEGSQNSHEDRLNVARLLVEGGANANTLNKDHETPLHVASRLASLEVVWVLLKHGADLTVENKEGKVPFQLARENIWEDMKRSQPGESSIWRARRAKWIVLMALLYGYY